MNAEPTQYDPATAYHEAGHAVAALALGRPVHRVSVRPNHQYLGRCEFAKGVRRPSDDWIETEILISLAGMAAEAWHTGGHCRAGAARDLRYARKLALYRATERTLDRYERRMLSKVESLLSDDGHAAAVSAIAAALMAAGEISGRQARHLFDQHTRGD